MLIHKGLCFPAITLHKDMDVLSYVSSLLYFQNMVEKDFKEQSQKKELSQPSGRDLGFIKIATPSPDFSCVKRDGLWIATFDKQGCQWALDTNEKATVSLVIGILATSQDSYDRIIQQLNPIFIEKNITQELLTISTPFKLAELLHTYFNTECRV